MSEINPRSEQLLTEFSQLIKSGQVTKEQILSFFEPEKPKLESAKINLQNLFYLLGAFIVIVGIVIFIYQFWGEMNQLTKVLLTIGPAISAYSTGFYFYQRGKGRDLGLAFLIIASAIYPLGIGSTLDLAGISAKEMSGLTIISTVLFIIYFASYLSLKNWVFLPFVILAGSSIFVTFTNLLFENTLPPTHFNEYRALVLGIVYIAFAYYFSLTQKRSLVNLLYFFGFVLFLGAAMALTGFQPKISVFWQFIYPFLLVLTFYLSILLQNKAVLIAGTIFTFGEILKLTYEYFSQSLGWPVALIIAGLVIMAVGYFSFEVNKRFIKKQPPGAGVAQEATPPHPDHRLPII